MLGKIWCSLITVTFTLLVGCVPQPKPVDKFDINKLLNVTDSEITTDLAIPSPAQQDPIWQTSLLT
ncbi:hypothetical protein, partial [Escherichia coli]